MIRHTAAVAASLFLVTTTSAQAEKKSAACAMAYTQFQAAIGHTDLDTCPAELAPTGSDRFCRATINNEQLHVYAFDFSGDKCLVAMKSFETGDFSVKAGK